MLTYDVGVSLRDLALLVGTSFLALAAAMVVLLLIVLHAVRREAASSCVHVHGHEERKEIIYVPESPMPSLTLSSPRNSPPVQLPHRFRRAGATRLMSHRRMKTKTFDPGLPGHCGYQAVLKASGVKPSLQKVKQLRNKVADAFLEARLASRDVAGIDLHDLLRHEEMTLSAYCAAIRSSQWASVVEISLAAEVLGSSLLYCGEQTVKIGEGRPRFAVRKIRSHYILQKIHRPIEVVPRSGTVARAGMRSQQEQSDPMLCVVLDQPVRGVGALQLQVSQFLDIRAVKVFLASVLQANKDHIEIYEFDDPTDPLPDWLPPPARCKARLIEAAARFYRLVVYIPERKVQFMMNVGVGTPKNLIEDQIAAMLDMMPQFMSLEQQNGQPWLPLDSVELQKVFLKVIGRAGVRTVSSTQPFEEPSTVAGAAAVEEEDGLIPLLENETDLEPEEQWRQHMVESAHSGRENSPGERAPRPVRERSRSRSDRNTRTVDRPDLQWRRQMREASALDRQGQVPEQEIGR